MRTIRPLEGRWARYDMRVEVRGMLEFMDRQEAAEAARRKQAAHVVGGPGSAWWKTVAQILDLTEG